MIYGYARVSTKGQAKDGNSLEAQVETLKQYGATDETIYKDSFTGTKMERPALTELLEKLEKGDTLVVTKLDRFARSVAQASGLLMELINKGVTIHVTTLGILSNSSVNQLMMNVLLAFAQFERDMIVERTQEGKAIAKEREGFKEGRPQIYDNAKIEMALELLQTRSYKEVVELTGISKSTLIRAKRKQEAK